jgi:hypothetical protein
MGPARREEKRAEWALDIHAEVWRVGAKAGVAARVGGERMTLIAVYKSGGDRGSVCVGRCDARCYEAKDANCDCICGGRNHGSGQQKAMDNTRELFENWIKEYEQAKGLNDAYVQWHVPAIAPQQQSLFGL